MTSDRLWMFIESALLALLLLSWIYIPA